MAGSGGAIKRVLPADTLGMANLVRVAMVANDLADPFRLPAMMVIGGSGPGGEHGRGNEASGNDSEQLHRFSPAKIPG